MKHKGVLSRLSHEDKQTLGRFNLYNDVTELFKCAILELPDRENKKRISRIPEGKYKCVKRWSPKYGHHYHVLDVERRTLILIHWGNYYTNTLGCLLAGNNIVDINGDGYRDVTSSKKTMNRLMSLGIESFELTIIDL